MLMTVSAISYHFSRQANKVRVRRWNLLPPESLTRARGGTAADCSACGKWKASSNIQAACKAKRKPFLPSVNSTVLTMWREGERDFES